MAIRYAENNIAAEYDKQAIEFIRRAVSLEERADTARSPQSANTYRKKAQELRKQAIDAIERAKIAARKSS